MNTHQFEIPLAHHRNDPHTSVTSADTARNRAMARRAQCILALRLGGPQTSHQIADSLGCHWSDVARRMNELLEAGTVTRKETGTHRGKPIYHTRQTPSGSTACVWYLA